jgi:hypothetical protein
MTVLRPLLMTFLFALGSAPATGNAEEVETIVVTAKRPETIDASRIVAVEAVAVPADFIEALVIVPPMLDYSELPLVPPRIALAQSEVEQEKG